MAVLDIAAVVSGVAWHVFKIILMIFVIGILIGGLIWLVYAGAIKPVLHPNPTTTENAQVIHNDSYYPSKKTFFLGLTLWGIDIGIQKNAYPTTPIIKTIETPTVPPVVPAPDDKS